MADYDVINNEAQGRFEVHIGDDVAFTEYRMTGRGILFPHTLVPEAFEGKGVGGALAKAALDWVRGQRQQVLPVCPFIAAWIKRHPDYHDLVHPLYRVAVGLPDLEAELEEGLRETFPASDTPSAIRREH
jgi:predicted GNAT family acetyltransferase